MFAWWTQVLHCQLYGQPWLIASHVVGGLGTFAAYVMIPLAILRIITERGMEFDYLAGLFAAFILMCGFGHLLDVISLWYPMPWITGVQSVLTAIVSAFTAWYCFRLIPVVVKFPTPEQWERAARVSGIIDSTAFWTNLEIEESNAEQGVLDLREEAETGRHDGSGDLARSPADGRCRVHDPLDRAG
jgi:hypothetical protein